MNKKFMVSSNFDLTETNNKTVASNQTTVVDKNKGKSVDTLMARAA